MEAYKSTFKYDVLTNGYKTIKIRKQFHKVHFMVEQYDQMVIATAKLMSMPELKAIQTMHLTGECPVAIANEITDYCEGDLRAMIQELEESMEDAQS